MAMPKDDAGTIGTLILMGDLQPVFRKLGGRKCPRPIRDRWASTLLPSAACRDPCSGDGAARVCSLCLGTACHLRQYCARTVYDKKPSAGQNDSVLDHKAARAGEIGE